MSDAGKIVILKIKNFYYGRKESQNPTGNYLMFWNGKITLPSNLPHRGPEQFLGLGKKHQGKVLVSMAEYFTLRGALLTLPYNVTTIYQQHHMFEMLSIFV